MIVTFILICINTAFALFINTIGDAMTLVGSTINPIIGFILPILFWYPYMKEKPWYSSDKICCLVTAVVITVSSVLSLVDFFGSIGADESPDSC